MKSYIATKRRKDNHETTHRFHVEAGNIREAAAKAEAIVDGLWEIIAVEVLE